MAALTASRATWNEHHLRAEAHRQTRQYRTTDRDQLIESVVTAATDPARSVRITLPRTLEEPVELRRRDGESVFHEHGSTLYTTAAVLDAERADRRRRTGTRRPPPRPRHRHRRPHPSRQRRPGLERRAGHPRAGVLLLRPTRPARPRPRRHRQDDRDEGGHRRLARRRQVGRRARTVRRGRGRARRRNWASPPTHSPSSTTTSQPSHPAR